MAGQPKKRALQLELEKRTRAEFEEDPTATHLDFVEHWQACGKTLNQLGVEVGLGPDEGEFISRYLKRAFPSENVTDRLTQARARGAHRLVDRALQTAEDADAESVNVARLQVSTMQWTAEKWNGREFGQAKGGVTISIGSLVLEALRSPTPAIEASAAIIPAIGSGDEVVTADVTIE